MQTDEEMLERVLQNSGYPGNGLRHDHQQLACSSLVFMIGLPELSLMTLVSEETVSKDRFQDTQRQKVFYFILFMKWSIDYKYMKTKLGLWLLILCCELPERSCEACPLIFLFL